MSGNRALRRALRTAPDQATVRLAGQPHIVDTTELITPERAQEILHHNRCNRPVNWRQVEKYTEIMERGEWKLHAQGIVIGSDGNLLTGQTRLWAVIYSGKATYFRISRGNPPDTGRYLDRGRPQSTRDLASRRTEKRHSPLEASLARAICAARGLLRPTAEDLADVLVANVGPAAEMLQATSGTKKTRAVLMLLAAICEIEDASRRLILARRIDADAEQLTHALRPATPEQAWSRGALFALAMHKAREIVRT